MEKVNITIVGAGVVGLAIAYELARTQKDIFVVEKNLSFGQETSSRNSEVIHAGIYYPKESLKCKTCIEGKQRLYQFCQKHHIPYAQTGKLIVAIDEQEVKDLEALLKKGLDNGVEDLSWLSKSEIKQIEPYVEAEAAILSPSTGILDSHRFMKTLADAFASAGGQIAYQTELVGVDKDSGGFNLRVQDKREGDFVFSSRILINCAGLNSDRVAALAGIERDDYRLKYCKGDYFRVHNNKGKFIKRLIYPVPKVDRPGLGIHATLDLAGSLRLGPDDQYVEKISYEVDPAKGQVFYESIATFLPFVGPQDLAIDIAGIRPKLQGEGEDFRDFLIKEESAQGLPGLINLIGIESPGLTACLAISKLVGQLVRDL